MLMNRIISVLFCFVLLLVPVSAGSTDSRWVTCEGRAELSNITASEAVQIALTEARRSAIEEVAGVQLASASIVQDFTLLSDVINSSSYGQITAEKVLQWDAEILQKDKTKPPVIVYKVKLSARVASPKGKPDPAFKLDAKLNKRVFTTGEEMFVQASANRNCFITLVNLTADSRAIILVPSAVRFQSRLAKGDYFRFPTKAEQASGIHLKVGTLPDHKKDREAIMVVATKTSRPLPPKLDNTPYYTADAIGSWLVDIPLSERFIKVLPYEIVSR
jgi:hypothetical protein